MMGASRLAALCAEVEDQAAVGTARMKQEENTPSASQQLVDQLADCAVIEQQEERARRVVVRSTMTRQRVSRTALVVAVPILIAVLVATVAWQPLMSLFETAPSPAMASQQAQAMLDALVVDIDAFQEDYDELPATLVDVGVPPRGQWSYATVDRTRYRVQGKLYGQVVSFDSASAGSRPAKERQ